MINKTLFALTLFIPLTIATSAWGMETKRNPEPQATYTVGSALIGIGIGTSCCLLFAKLAAPARAYDHRLGTHSYVASFLSAVWTLGAVCMLVNQRKNS